MTNINCLKTCQYQIDGKCCCDSVMLPFLGADATGDPDCPYQTMPQNDMTQKEAVAK